MSASYVVGVGMEGSVQPPRLDEPEQPQWYAVQTRCRFEKKVAAQLQQKGYETYLPVRTERHAWSDREKSVTVPLFPGYAFVQISRSAPERRRVLATAGLIGFVSFGKIIATIPRKQIEYLRLVLKENAPFSLHPFVKTGRRVRVRGGSLNGIEGILLRHDKEKLVLSVDAIQRSLAIEIHGYELELI